MIRAKRGEFGSGSNEFNVEANCINGRDCLVFHKAITVYSDGCNGDVLNEIEEMYKNKYKYRWHDLRKNLDDIPDDDRNVNVCLRVDEDSYSYHTAYYSEEHEWTLPMDGSPNEVFDDVIAWREIEPFKGGE